MDYAKLMVIRTIVLREDIREDLTLCNGFE